MKDSTQDEAKGKANEIKGKAKAAAGSLLGKPKLEAEGRDQRHSGQVQAKVGQVEKVFGK